MTLRLSQHDFDFMAGLLKQRSGLSITPDKTYLLETRLLPLARAAGIKDIPHMIKQLRAEPSGALAHQAVEAMTTNESMFFRDSKPFEHLSNIVFPAMKAAGKNRIRILSAACATGQEPYSIAMLLKEEMAKYPGLTAEILATDIAEKVLERARTGLYSQFEVQRGLPITLLMKYFTQAPNAMWQISESVKSMVKFAPANLLAPLTANGRFDIIFCRNVLIYFDTDTKTDVLNRLAAIMNPPGYLFLGGAEGTHGLGSKFMPHGDNRGLFTLVP